jgi:hypothetical protein
MFMPLGYIMRPENPGGVKPSTLAFWMEYPCPVADKRAVIPPDVWYIGNDVKRGALLKSKSTVWLKTAE